MKVKEEIINLKLKIKNGKSFNEKPKNYRKRIFPEEKLS